MFEANNSLKELLRNLISMKCKVDPTKYNLTKWCTPNVYHFYWIHSLFMYYEC